MSVFREINQLQALVQKGTAATIGNFDGVHLGHQQLLARVKEQARQKKLTSLVITFDPHPLRVLIGETPPFITLTDQKMELLKRQGLDAVLCLQFDKQMAALSPEDFVLEYLVKGVNLKQLVIGHDYTFGQGRRGDFDLLKELGQEYGFEVEQIDPVYLDQEVVSSTRIRNMVLEGSVKEVRPLLGRFYQVKGTVKEGKKRGGPLLGVPTANLKLVDELSPKTGVYAVWAEVNDHLYKGMANLGYNPTFGQEALSMEIHILDFDQNIYGQDLKVHFVERIRDERKFSDVEDLKSQIFKDIEQGKEILNQPDVAMPEI